MAKLNFQQLLQSSVSHDPLKTNQYTTKKKKLKLSLQGKNKVLFPTIFSTQTNLFTLIVLDSVF